MRPTWRTFRPNVALAQAGLLVADSAGRIDLARTRALSPNGYWVTLNRTAWKGGIVPPADERAVLDLAQRALEGARGTDGAPIVTRVWRVEGNEELGLGGPTGGDLYYDVADGYAWSSQAAGAVASPTTPRGAHGYPSTRADMQTVLCAAGAALPARRLPPARIIDAAPTVAEWLGVRAPADAVGRSLLGAMLAR
jgi:predicted AlkP superfamily phosphohydrolase/phosphomutase